MNGAFRSCRSVQSAATFVPPFTGGFHMKGSTMNNIQGMSKTDVLEAIEDIKQTKARYFRCMDQKDWDGFQDTMDVAIDFNVSGAIYAINQGTGQLYKSGDKFIDPALIDQSFWQQNGAAAVRAWEEGALHPFQTMHQGHMPEVTILTANTAKAIFTLTHHLRFQTSNQFSFLPFAPDDTPAMELFGYGYYTEDWVRNIDGKWRIKHLRFTSFRVELKYAR